MSAAPVDWTALLAQAWAARERSYAPYSQYRVGAALQAEDGRVFVGTNVENASYGLAICAERSAIAAAVVAGARRFTAVAIVSGGAHPASPCGMCRQVLAEFPPGFVVRCVSEAGETLESTTEALLPHAFGPASLGIEPERSTMVMGTSDDRRDTDRPAAPSTPPPSDSILPRPGDPFVGVALKVAAGTGAELTHAEVVDPARGERGRS
ncbi:MAG: cytidine deaminase [Sandaracinus sp.]